ncbi:uncharacterized protein LOC133803901 [Humulus lupulus]|uniref:uncharacterized protein LOC133803901 n=1 Tax=Humulus lupulus TaxID=3486 RepID=UPI002B40A4FF|nr:uncharacterized protein LOC133803901 [Humulus lupulus]
MTIPTHGRRGHRRRDHLYSAHGGGLAMIDHLFSRPEFQFGSKVQQWNKHEVIAALNKVFTKKQKAIFRRTTFGCQKNLMLYCFAKTLLVSLYFHWKKKQEDGYLTNDEFNDKLLEKR